MTETERPTTVLITGATGLLGRSVLHHFEQFNHQNTGNKRIRVIGTGFSRADPSTGIRKVDLLEAEAVKQLVYGERPHFVIHAAAERKPDKVESEPERTEKLNIHSVWTLAQCAANIGAHFVQISTDYVFDGSSPPYSEETYPHPVNTYGRSKLRAEHAALAAHPTATVLRVPVLYGKTTLLSESAITSLVSKVKNREHCQEDHYCVRLPTYVDDVSKVLLELFKRCADAAVANGVSTHVAASVLGMDGHLHWSNVERFTKYEICQLIGRIMGTSTEHISPKTDTPPSTGAVRPKVGADCQLSVNRVEGILGWNQKERVTSLKDGLQAVLQFSQLV